MYQKCQKCLDITAKPCNFLYMLYNSEQEARYGHVGFPDGLTGHLCSSFRGFFGQRPAPGWGVLLGYALLTAFTAGRVRS